MSKYLALEIITDLIIEELETAVSLFKVPTVHEERFRTLATRIVGIRRIRDKGIDGDRFIEVMKYVNSFNRSLKDLGYPVLSLTTITRWLANGIQVRKQIADSLTEEQVNKLYAIMRDF